MNIKQLFFSFEGRIGRLHWWIAMLSVELLSSALATAGFWLVGEDPSYYWSDAKPTQNIALIELLAFTLTLRFALAVDIKRIHDRARSAYLLVPLYLFGLIATYVDDKGRDIFILLDLFSPGLGENHSLIVLVLLSGLFLVMLLFFLWMLIQLGFLRGTKGDNKYGPDPLGKPIGEKD